jgi:hypothetical protein
VERTQTISHQLRVLARGVASRQRGLLNSYVQTQPWKHYNCFVCVANIDEASDLEACKLLAANAQNLNLAISETLRHTHSACIRIDKATRKKLGLSKIENPSSIVSQISVTKSVLRRVYVTSVC